MEDGRAAGWFDGKPPERDFSPEPSTERKLFNFGAICAGFFAADAIFRQFLGLGVVPVAIISFGLLFWIYAPARRRFRTRNEASVRHLGFASLENYEDAKRSRLQRLGKNVVRQVEEAAEKRQQQFLPMADLHYAGPYEYFFAEVATRRGIDGSLRNDAGAKVVVEPPPAVLDGAASLKLTAARLGHTLTGSVRAVVLKSLVAALVLVWLAMMLARTGGWTSSTVGLVGAWVLGVAVAIFGVSLGLIGGTAQVARQSIQSVGGLVSTGVSLLVGSVVHTIGHEASSVPIGKLSVALEDWETRVIQSLSNGTLMHGGIAWLLRLLFRRMRQEVSRRFMDSGTKDRVGNITVAELEEVLRGVALQAGIRAASRWVTFVRFLVRTSYVAVALALGVAILVH